LLETLTPVFYGPNLVKDVKIGEEIYGTKQMGYVNLFGLICFLPPSPMVVYFESLFNNIIQVFYRIAVLGAL